MSIGYNLLYRLEGFQHQRDSDFHAHSFNIHVDSDFVRKAFQTELPENVYDELNEQGEDIMRMMKYEKIPGEEPYSFYNNQNGRSLLIAHARAPGDACELGLDGDEFEHLMKGNFEPTIAYSYHNIDSLQQKVTLLSLFVNWVDTAELLIK